MKKTILSSLIISSFIGMAQPAKADLVSIILQPILSLVSTCSISSTDIAFGNLTASGTPANNWAIGTISAKCTRNTSYNIQLNYGTSVDSNNYRRMTGTTSGEKFIYTVCKDKTTSGSVWGVDAGCGVPWRGSTYPVTSSGTGNLQTFTMYALTKTNFYVPDTYTDTMTATLVY